MTGGRNPRRASTGLGPSSHHHPAPSGSSKPRSEATYSQDDSDDSQESPDSRIEDPLSSYAPNFVDMMADLSTAEAFVFEKSDYISKWQESAHTGQDARERDHIRTIYRACTGYYSLLLPDILDSSKCEDYEKSNLRRTYHLLREWGAAYGVMEGRLDQLAEEGSDVTETIFSFLIEISRILAQSMTTQNILAAL